MKWRPPDPGVQATRADLSALVALLLTSGLFTAPFTAATDSRSQPCGNDPTLPPLSLHQWPPRFTALSTPTCNGGYPHSQHTPASQQGLSGSTAVSAVPIQPHPCSPNNPKSVLSRTLREEMESAARTVDWI